MSRWNVSEVQKARLGWRSALLLSTALAGGLAAQAASAQTAPVADAAGVAQAATDAAGVAQAATDAASVAQVAAAADIDAVVVTGTRTSTTSFESSSPVQVVRADTIVATGRPDLRTALGAVVPSYLASQSSNGSSSSKPVRTASLRGLGGNQVLVLVNGRRRHNTSLLNNTGGTAGAPVDLALIPAGSVARIEVLSDGASAQYGSEAIGGVINVILKSAASGGDASFQIGQYDGSAAHVGDLGDYGRTFITSLNAGFGLGPNGGFLNLTGEYTQVLSSNVVGPIGAPTTSVRQIFANPNDPRENTESRYRQLTEVAPFGTNGLLSYNLEYPAAGVTFYSNGTLGISSLRSTGTYRSENNPATILGVSPDGGYLPTLNTKQFDYQADAGVKGDDLLGWKWDASVNVGSNRARMYVNGINASFGGKQPMQQFYIGQLKAGEVIADFDVKRSFNTGWFAEPLDVALGVEYRRNTFSEGTGEYYSYANGGYVYPANYPSAVLRNTGAGIGSPFMTGFTPDESGNWNRSNEAVYIDLSQNVTEKLKISLAGRYEHYSDFGGAVSGKASARYEIIPELAIRATVNNGFRAPSLAEQYTTVANQGPFNTGTQIIQVNAYNSIRYDNPGAAALGATPLNPEKSLNFSTGFVAKPFHNFNFSVDAYQIKITDRIGLTGQFNGTVNSAAGRAVAAALRAVGQDPNVRIQYFTNIGDTRTRGLELKADYTSDFGRWGTVNWSVSDALNQQKVTRAASAPPALAAAGLVLLQTSARAAIEHGTPKNIAKGSVAWSIGKFKANVTETYYSKTYVSNSTFPDNPDYNSVSSSAFITDLSLAYDVLSRVRFTVGANNLFNKRADNVPAIAVPLITTGYIYPAPVAAPFGTGGAFYYARVGVSW